MGSAFEDVAKVYSKQLDVASAAAAMASKSWQEIVSNNTDYASRWLEKSRLFSEKLASAKSADETVRLQSEFYKAAYEDFFAHAQKIGSLYSDLAKEGSKKVEGALPTS
jgi:hypothetical protein